MDTRTLFAAIVIILLVMASAFLVAGCGGQKRPYWRNWFFANLLIAAALTPYIFAERFSDTFLMMVPNALLVAGFALRWRAAREFNERIASHRFLLLSLGLYAAAWALPYAEVYTTVNLILGALCFATAWEFWRDRADGLPSRYGLTASYAALAISFGARVAHDLSLGSNLSTYLPADTLLVAHLLVAVFHSVGTGAFALSIAYERKHRLLREAAQIDSLTGLLNRGAFERRLRQQLDAGQRDFALAVFDLDHFKKVNDTYGHAAGDEALRQCAQHCRQLVGDSGMAARIGGEEFALLLEHTSTENAVAAIERLRRMIDATIISDGGRHFRVSISAGVCDAGSTGGGFDALMRAADARLYAAKGNGRNRIEYAVA